MLSYDQAAAKMQWREAVRAVTEAIEDAGGVANNVNDAKLDAVGGQEKPTARPIPDSPAVWSPDKERQALPVTSDQKGTLSLARRRKR